MKDVTMPGLAITIKFKMKVFIINFITKKNIA